MFQQFDVEKTAVDDWSTNDDWALDGVCTGDDDSTTDDDNTMDDVSAIDDVWMTGDNWIIDGDCDIDGVCSSDGDCDSTIEDGCTMDDVSAIDDKKAEDGDWSKDDDRSIDRVCTGDDSSTDDDNTIDVSGIDDNETADIDWTIDGFWAIDEVCTGVDSLTTSDDCAWMTDDETGWFALSDGTWLASTWLAVGCGSTGDGFWTRLVTVWSTGVDSLATSDDCLWMPDDETGWFAVSDSTWLASTWLAVGCGSTGDVFWTRLVRVWSTGVDSLATSDDCAWMTDDETGWFTVSDGTWLASTWLAVGCGSTEDAFWARLVTVWSTGVDSLTTSDDCAWVMDDEAGCCGVWDGVWLPVGCDGCGVLVWATTLNGRVIY